MRIFASIALAMVVVTSVATAQLAEDTRSKLSAGLGNLGPDTEPDEARELVFLLADEKVTDADWRTFFSEYFKERPFTPVFAEFFHAAFSETEGADQARLARVSGIATAAALGESLKALARQVDEAEYGAAATALAWLYEIVGGLSAESAAAVLESMRASLAGKSSAIVPVSGSPSVADPQFAWLGAQLGLVLRDYGVRSGQGAVVGGLLNLQGGGLRFWQSYGVLLLDNSGLDAAQVESLGALYGAIPTNLHNIGAIIVPESTGIGEGSPELRLQSGQIVAIPNIPMDRLTWEREFAPNTAQPVGSEFTVAAAQQILRAVQAVQLAARPELAIRRTAILMDAGPRPEAYLRRAVAPEVYLQSPDELLPSLAYPWFVDSVATFQTAVYLFELGQNVAFDQFLLMADLLSGGGGQAPLFITSPGGAVDRASTPIFRAPLSPLGAPAGMITSAQPRATYVPGTPYVTGIVMGGIRWQFDIGPGGTVIRHHKWLRE